jgi:hypothetical protein
MNNNNTPSQQSGFKNGLEQTVTLLQEQLSKSNRNLRQFEYELKDFDNNGLTEGREKIVESRDFFKGQCESLSLTIENLEQQIQNL